MPTRRTRHTINNTGVEDPLRQQQEQQTQAEIEADFATLPNNLRREALQGEIREHPTELPEEAIWQGVGEPPRPAEEVDTGITATTNATTDDTWTLRPPTYAAFDQEFSKKTEAERKKERTDYWILQLNELKVELRDLENHLDKLKTNHMGIIFHSTMDRHKSQQQEIMNKYRDILILRIYDLEKKED